MASGCERKANPLQNERPIFNTFPRSLGCEGRFRSASAVVVFLLNQQGARKDGKPAAHRILPLN